MRILKGLLGMALLAGSLLYLDSCAKDATQETQSALGLATASNIDFLAVDPSTAEDGNPCYSLVFPLTVKVADKEITVNSQEELNRLMGRGTSNAKVRLVFPYSVKIIATGDVVVINSEEDLQKVMMNCRGEKRDTTRRDTVRPDTIKFGCYKLVFPLTVKLADGSTQTVSSVEELNALRRANPGRLSVTIQFPFDVILKDGTKVTVHNLQELREIEKTCGPRRPGRIGG